MKHLFRRLLFTLLIGICLLQAGARAATVSGLTGQSATFAATSGGTAPLSFQWYKNGVVMSGATSSSFTISSLDASDAGSYSVKVTNALGTVESAVTSLDVVVPPAITTQPQALVVNQGNAATFSIGVSGSAPFTYQWKKAGVILPGATSSTYTIASALSSDAGSYSVEVTNASGIVTSSPATLNVTVPPRIVTQPASQRIDAGKALSLSVNATSTVAMTYQWMKGGVAISGATGATYLVPSAVASDAGVYSVVVSNSAGSLVSSGATIAVTVLPSIWTQPSGKTVNKGASVTFSVYATSSVNLSFQWKFNGVNIPGATATSYTITSVSEAHVGAYSVAVTNSVGSVLSSSANLNVLLPPTITTQPSSQTASVGSSVSFNVVGASTLAMTYQWYKAGVAISGATSSSYSIAAVTASSAGSYTVTIANSAGSISSNAATLTVAQAPTITTQPVSQTINVGKAVTFSVVGSSTVTMTYQWMKAGVAISGATSSSYSIAAVSAASAGSYSVTITNSAGSVTSNAATLTVTQAPTITTQPANVSANVGKAATFSVVASSSVSMTYQWRKNGTAISGATAATYTIAAVAAADAATYSVVVTNAAGSVTSSNATLTVTQLPVITTQPGGLTITVGKSASFNVVATSSVSMTYQWKKNGVAIAGATSAAYSIPVIASTDAGSYTVTVTNTAGSVTSSAAVLTVNAASTYNRMSSLSIRTVIDASNTTSVVGFVTEGTNTRRILVRGIGPGLTKYGTVNVLAQPKLEVFTKVNDVDTVIASNTSWSETPNAAAAFIEAGAFALDAGSKDTAVVLTLNPGAYTVVLSGVSGSVGTALIELYELP